MPFITVATNPDLVQTNDYYKSVYELFRFESASAFIIAFGFLLIGFYLFRGGLSFFQVWALARFSNMRRHFIAYRLFSRYLMLSYRDFSHRNSAKMTKSITNDAGGTLTLINSFLNLVSEFSVVIILYGFLIVVNWKITTVLTVILAIKVFLLLKTVSKTIAKQGIKSAAKHSELFETINDSLGNFKLIKMLGNEKTLLERFAQASIGYAKAGQINIVLQNVPRILLETVGFTILIALVIYVVYKYNDATFVLPIVSMFALALYRLLPSAQRIMLALNQLQFSMQSLRIVYADLTYDVEEEGDRPVAFDKAIELKRICFGFEPTKPILRDLDLTIEKGGKIGFVGESGSGKSTLVDLISGIYKPQSGAIEIDGSRLTNENIKSWRKKIGYIPQDVYLFDGSVGENVAFGYEYDENRAIEALKKANIYEFLLTHEGLQTRVGEGGILLSGGQRQRIGIARALYGDPPILVLDEATSALDSQTEAKIMDEIYEAAQDKTLLAIAHRISTLSRCDTIYTLNQGYLSRFQRN
jgi:ABC-type multidrug transport system fused ATPase/permease subunit